MRWNLEAVEWHFIVALTLACGAAIAIANPTRAAEPADQPADVAEATDLPPAIRAIQNSLGGPLADRFDGMRESELPGTPWWRRFNQSRMALVAPASAQSGVEVPGLKVLALRDAAAELDDSANRLESLDLYQQADALRDAAQRLRVDARRMAGGPGSSRGPAPVPAWGVSPFGGTIVPEGPPRLTPEPQLAPSPSPTPPSTLMEPRDEDEDSAEESRSAPAVTPAPLQ